MSAISALTINDGTNDQTMTPLTAQQGNNIPAEWTNNASTFAESQRMTLLVRPTTNGNGNRKVSVRYTVPYAVGDEKKSVTINCDMTIPADAGLTERTAVFTALKNALNQTVISDGFTLGSPAY